MARIIAGRFDTQADADRAIDALKSAGFQSDEYLSFFLNPPGQHATYAIGGDAHHDEGTKESGTTAAKGAAIGGAGGLVLGAAVGAATGFPAAGAVAGVGVGAYVGSLAGTLSGTHSGDPEHASVQEPVERSSGMMVAVCVDRSGAEEQAVRTLRAQGALDIERATGEWRDGTWVDFDPRRTPELVDAPEGEGPRGPAGPRP